MQFVNEGYQYKSLLPGDATGVELSELMVVSGPNGSGKSNLLEAVEQRVLLFDDLGTVEPHDLRLFRLGELAAATEGPVAASAYKEPWANIFNQISSYKQQAIDNLRLAGDGMHSWVYQQIYGSQVIDPISVSKLEQQMGHSIIDATIQEFQEHGPLLPGVRDPFITSIAELFLTYNARWVRHQMSQWRYEKDPGANPPPQYTDEQFFERFGPLPWKLLTETLQIVGLQYTFESPPDDSENANYEVKLSSGEGQPSIRVGDLSSGERVLLAIAMSLFTGSNLADNIRLPKVLLLDEADASLHPAMVKSLLTVIREVFIKQYGVRVILATHSPSTVALAPESSLYLMSKSAPRLKKTTTDEALKWLTVGIPALSVKLENRRQVFVESEYDQGIFQALQDILKNRVESERSAEFIASGRRDVGGGCDRVKALVADLRGAGVDSVFGIVDRDERQGAPPAIKYVADRYSIENVVFDPLLLGVFLMRELILTPEELGLAPGLRVFELRPSDAASIVTSVATRLGYTQAVVAVEYVGGFAEQVPEDFLSTRGHDLEAHAVATFPALNRYRTRLKLEVVMRAAADVPEFIPKSVLDLLEEVLVD